MGSKVVAVRMPADVLEGIDGRAKNRSAFIVEAVRASRPAHAETCRCGICQLRRK